MELIVSVFGREDAVGIDIIPPPCCDVALARTPTPGRNGGGPSSCMGGEGRVSPLPPYICNRDCCV